MSLWFSASAVAPLLKAEWGLSDASATWLTLSVQLGFVAGTLASAILNLPDVWAPRQLVIGASLLGAAANASLALFSHGPASALVLRFLTGFCLAGVYPPGMKILASWFRARRGLALGALVGALTLGKGFPYLVNAVFGSAWRSTLLATSGLTLLGAVLVVLFVREGPFAPAAARFDPAQAAKVFANRGVRLATFGYFGHMWELYAMWTWIPVMLRSSFALRGLPPAAAEAASFFVIGCGAAGCVLGGPRGRSQGPDARDLRRDGGQRRVLRRDRALLRRPAPRPPRRRGGLGRFGRRGLGAVLGGRHRARRPRVHGYRAHAPDLARLPPDERFRSTSCRRCSPRSAGDGSSSSSRPDPALGVLAMLRLRALPEAAKIAQGRR